MLEIPAVMKSDCVSYFKAIGFEPENFFLTWLYGSTTGKVSCHLISTQSQLTGITTYSK